MNTQSKFKSVLLVVIFSPLMLGKSFAQVTPAIQLAGRGVLSFNAYRLSGDAEADQTSAVNDFSDTGLLFGLKQKLYNNYRSRFVIGLQFPDADSDLGQVFFHQIHFQLENRWSIFRLGRSRVRSSLIEFPTLRDDDALQFTDVLNPFSAGRNTEESQYGNVAEAGLIGKQRFYLIVHGEHFTETPVPPATSEEDFSLNAIGATIEYRVPPAQRFNRNFISQIGLAWNNFLTDRPGYSGFDRALKDIIFSGIINVLPDPVYFVDVRYQGIYSFGFDEIQTIRSFADLTRAKSLAHFASLRLLYRKLERPTAQISLGFGYKSFPDLRQKTTARTLILNGYYRLGENLDIGLQYQFMNLQNDLLNLYTAKEHSIKLALVFSFEQIWNEFYDERDSLLNLEHGYLK